MPIAITARSHRTENKKSKYNGARVGLGLSDRKRICRSALSVLIFIFVSRWESGRDGDLNYMCNEVGNSLFEPRGTKLQVTGRRDEFKVCAKIIVALKLRPSNGDMQLLTGGK